MILIEIKLEHSQDSFVKKETKVKFTGKFTRKVKRPKLSIESDTEEKSDPMGKMTGSKKSA